MPAFQHTDYAIIETFDISKVPDEEMAEFHRELLKALEEREEQLVADVETLEETTELIRKRSVLRDFAHKHFRFLFILLMFFLSGH